MTSPEKNLWEQRAAIIEAEFVAQHSKVASLEEQLAAEQKLLAARSLAHEAVKGVVSSWKEEDPGYYAPAFFLLAGKDEERVVADELLEPGDREVAARLSYSAVSLHYVHTARCPACSGSASLPLIEMWRDDSSDDAPGPGKRVLVACPSCGAQDVKRP